MTLFQTLFNVVVIWMAIFIGLSKGLKSYGKVSLIFGVVPIVGLVVFCTKVHTSNFVHHQRNISKVAIKLINSS